MDQNDGVIHKQQNGDNAAVITELNRLKSDIHQIQEDITRIMRLLQTQKPDVSKAADIDQFFGMWSDFTPEEEEIFQQIAEERSYYFTNEPPDIGDIQ